MASRVHHGIIQRPTRLHNPFYVRSSGRNSYLAHKSNNNSHERVVPGEFGEHSSIILSRFIKRNYTSISVVDCGKRKRKKISGIVYLNGNTA